MPNVYFAGFFAVLILATAAGIYVKGGNDREARITAMYAARDLQAAQAYAAKEKSLQDAYRAKEAEWSKRFVSASRTYQGKVAENAKALDIALASGRLYDRFAADSSASRDCPASTASPASGHNGSAGAYISEASGIFLRRLAAEADGVVIQLTACQQLLIDERK